MFTVIFSEWNKSIFIFYFSSCVYKKMNFAEIFILY